MTGTVTLETILDLAKSKITEKSIANTFSASTSSETSRLDRLEKMIENMVTHIASTHISQQNNQRTCRECERTNHSTRNCNRLKTCFLCNERGHIRLFCPRKKVDSSGIGSEMADDVNITPAARLMLNVSVKDTKVEFLYDPGSEYTMLTAEAYKGLKNRPPLSRTT